jgi:hypothetical protein
MKKDSKDILKAIVALMIVPLMLSSCVVRERTHRPPPPEKVIIRP